MGAHRLSGQLQQRRKSDSQNTNADAGDQEESKSRGSPRILSRNELSNSMASLGKRIHNKIEARERKVSLIRRLSVLSHANEISQLSRSHLGSRSPLQSPSPLGSGDRMSRGSSSQVAARLLPGDESAPGLSPDELSRRYSAAVTSDAARADPPAPSVESSRTHVGSGSHNAGEGEMVQSPTSTKPEETTATPQLETLEHGVNITELENMIYEELETPRVRHGERLILVPAVQGYSFYRKDNLIFSLLPVKTAKHLFHFARKYKQALNTYNIFVNIFGSIVAVLILAGLHDSYWMLFLAPAFFLVTTPFVVFVFCIMTSNFLLWQTLLTFDFHMTFGSWLLFCVSLAMDVLPDNAAAAASLAVLCGATCHIIVVPMFADAMCNTSRVSVLICTGIGIASTVAIFILSSLREGLWKDTGSISGGSAIGVLGLISRYWSPASTASFAILNILAVNLATLLAQWQNRRFTTTLLYCRLVRTQV
jgi:hypothetical protein